MYWKQSLVRKEPINNRSIIINAINYMGTFISRYPHNNLPTNAF